MDAARPRSGAPTAPSLPRAAASPPTSPRAHPPPPPALSLLRAADVISAVEFDNTGDFLATGDCGGRVVLFERAAARPAPPPPDARPPPPGAGPPPHELRYLTEFQSHVPEFDYLKSLEIEEKVNRVRWLRRWPGAGGAHHLLTTNDKTVKLWRVAERRVTSLADFNLQPGAGGALADAGNGARRRPPAAPPAKASAAPGGAAALRLPRVVAAESVLAARCRRVFASAHAYHINSVSLAADAATFLSADDLRINLWHLDRPDTAFCAVDIKPPSMEDLTEVITCAEFHPRDAALFAHSSSKGCVRLADTRAAALCDAPARVFGSAEPPGPRSFFSEIIASVNDVRWAGPDGRLLLARDYMAVRVWDVRREAAPLATHAVHEPLRSRLCELYESDAIFDKFDAAASGDGRRLATGTYSGLFRVVDGLDCPGGAGPSGGENGPAEGGGAAAASSALLEVSRDPQRRRLAAARSPAVRLVGFGRAGGGRARAPAPPASAAGDEAVTADFSAKVQHLAWHPSADVIAAAAANSLYLFHGAGAEGAAAR